MGDATSTKSPQTEAPKLLWGASEVAAFIGRDRRQAYRLLESGVLPGKKLGNTWVTSIDDLRRALGLVRQCDASPVTDITSHLTARPALAARGQSTANNAKRGGMRGGLALMTAFARVRTSSHATRRARRATREKEKYLSGPHGTPRSSGPGKPRRPSAGRAAVGNTTRCSAESICPTTNWNRGDAEWR
jgi:hypothetical protein